MTVVRIGRRAAWLLGVALAAWGCEPASITEARDQLRRGGERTFDLTIPIVGDTFNVQSLFDTATIGLDTTANGVLAVKLDPESLSVAFGQQLSFDNVTLDQFTLSFTGPELMVPPGTPIGFTATYDALASEARVQAVDTMVLNGGSFTVTTQNRLPITAPYTMTLNGFTDALGAPLSGSSTLPAAPGDGSYVSDALTFNLAGVTLVPAVSQIVLTVSAISVGAIDPTLGTNAIIQDGLGNFIVETLIGSLDPVATPELVITVEQSTEIDTVDFGDIEDAIKNSTLNVATLTLRIANSAQAPAVLSNFNLGVVRLDVAGNVPRDALGDPLFEADAGGTPILVSVVDPGQTTLTLARASVVTIALAAGALTDRLVQIILANDRAAIVAAGTVTIGDGAPSRVGRSDVVDVRFDTTVDLDFTIPATGVEFTRNTTESGLSLDPQDADDFTSRVDTVAVLTDVTNQTPFGVAIDIAFVADLDSTLIDLTMVDVFTQPGAVVLSTISLAASTVDSQGRVTQPSSGTVTIGLTGPQLRELLGDRFTAGVRVRLLPGTGGGGRGAIQATDQVMIDARVRLVVRAGGPQ